jgi:hypothetical protein
VMLRAPMSSAWPTRSRKGGRQVFSRASRGERPW